MNKRKIETHA